MIKIIEAVEFNDHFKSFSAGIVDEKVNAVVNEIIAAVRAEGDKAVRRYSERFEKSVPAKFEIPPEAAKEAWESLESSEPKLAAALALSAKHIRRFSELQKEQFRDFEAEMESGLFTGQRVIPVERAAVYVPGGRFPLVSSAFMTFIPAAVAGVREKILVSPPREDGLPDRRILAAAYLAGADRIFALGGAQAVAALALGTETVPRVDLIAGPGNKYVVAAKRLLFGEVGIDFLPGPTDVLVIAGERAKTGTDAAEAAARAADLIAADMLAQAEHDPDACARVLAPDRETACLIEKALENRLAALSSADTAAAIAAASLDAGGLIIVYSSKEEAIDLANKIAPEHLEIHAASPEEWIGDLRNYGSLFIGSMAAEVLGDYSAGINHTLPTSGTARFTGGLSVRHFLKTVTTLRCAPGKGYAEALAAAETIARAEGLAAHAESAIARNNKYQLINKK